MQRPGANVGPLVWLAAVGAALAAVLGGLAAGGQGQDGPDEGAGVAPGGAAKGAGGEVRYDRDIRPILSDRCFQCHGPDAAKRQAQLRLDEEASATAERKSGPAIVAGDPDKSELWRRINEQDPAEAMPPQTSNKRRLSAEERALIRRWIEGGAKYEPHWSFVPPVRSAEPTVQKQGWARNPVDRFVLAAMEAKRIEPSPEADKARLLRRVFLDLTGLPPTPEELDEFLADTRADAYERWVDRLMAEEPYRTRHAEHLASPWMDQARYADTCGIHMDAGRQMWLWRDWVLNAYRENVPFDRFVTEQMAGDLIPDATEDQRIASGFNRNHVSTDEGGAIAEEYLVEYAVDRAATTGAVFLGLSVGCARCHDHKFDPISNSEFYSFYSYFNSIEEPGLYSQTPDFNRAYEPFISVPTAAQKESLARIETELADLRAKQEVRTPEEEEQRTTYFDGVARRAGLAWAPAQVTAAKSTGGSTLEPQPDGSVVAKGENPQADEHEITLRTDATGLRLLQLEALPEPTAFEGRPGRAENGNAVLSGISAEAVSVADPLKRVPLKFVWAWADHSQQNGDHEVTNLLPHNSTNGSRGWALDAHRRKEGHGGRVAVLLASEPFGFEGGTDVRVTVSYKTSYAHHTLAHLRLSLGTINEAGLGLLPPAPSRWYVVGPFPEEPDKPLFDHAYGPEELPGSGALDFPRNYGFGNQYWRFDENLADARISKLADGKNVSYVGKVIWSPTAREVEVSLGSDDGFRLFVNGAEIASKNIERMVAADQDKATIPLRPGANTLVMKIVNTGGAAAHYYKPTETAELAGDLAAAVVAAPARNEDLNKRLERAWRVAFLPSYREAAARIVALEKESRETNNAVARTMVMKELDKPRDTFVLMRGQYDKPDKARQVQRGVPAALGALPEGAPENRLGLAQWLTAPENPLMARVTVNRLWEQFFGTGLVRTSQDFGHQGEWPSHPELLDWLAVEFREKGWDVRHVVRLIVTSATYRQASKVRPELKEMDPDNRLLAFYPRRRLTAEQIRDQALYLSGLLVEKTGGPSVKPYQPEGLWQEVAMLQSNTREYKPGKGEDNWRRSLYTYWKRAAPPPSLLTFDAPTREFCTIRRIATETPLQALVLWNDEQFVEAARVLAARTLGENGEDASRLAQLFRRCTGRAPEGRELAALSAALSGFRERFAAAPADAEGILKKGEAPLSEDLAKPELAAWTMIASAALNLYETTMQE